MIVAFTGSRPNNFGGFYLPNPIYSHVCREIDRTLRELKPDKIISGMSLGVDQWAAFVAIKLGIPFVAAIPFEGQELLWNKESQKTYHSLLKKANEVVIVSPGKFDNEKFQIRNQWMIDRCDKLICIWDGQSKGTKNCFEYAKYVGKEIIFIDPVVK